jgi:hypothetical protein
VLGRLGSGIVGSLRYGVLHEGFSGRNLTYSMSTTAMHVGVSSLMGRRCGHLLLIGIKVKTLDNLGLDCGARRCYPLEGIVLELWYPLLSFSCFWGQFLFSFYFFISLIYFVEALGGERLWTWCFGKGNSQIVFGRHASDMVGDDYKIIDRV